eukprot:8285895-Pyramimonas_sp.AAC.1
MPQVSSETWFWSSLHPKRHTIARSEMSLPLWLNSTTSYLGMAGSCLEVPSCARRLCASASGEASDALASKAKMPQDAAFSIACARHQPNEVDMLRRRGAGWDNLPGLEALRVRAMEAPCAATRVDQEIAGAYAAF